MPAHIDDRTIWAQWLLGARKAANLGRTDLSRRIGLHLTTISLIERAARMPSAEVIVAWLHACGAEPIAIPRQFASAYTSLDPERLGLVWKFVAVLAEKGDDPKFAVAARAAVEGLTSERPVMPMPEPYRLRHPEKT